MNNQELAAYIVKAVGGSENIVSVTHCATRLRFALKDKSIPPTEEIKKQQGVLGVAVGGGQYQVIIGSTVPKVFAEVQKIAVPAASAESDSGETEKKKPMDAVLEFTAAIFSPILPALIGAGLINALLSLAVLFGMSTDTTLYTLISVIGNAPLYFSRSCWPSRLQSAWA